MNKTAFSINKELDIRAEQNIIAQSNGNHGTELFETLEEFQRQEQSIELIASENATYPEVLKLAGSVLTNKYAEGYPAKRYYGGCEAVDKSELLAINRAKELFGAAYANVQPHSGSNANMAVYFAMLKPQDTILGMSLDQGGHLTHGSPASFSGKIFEAHHYGIHPKTSRIDYDALRKQALELKPKMIVAGASAYPRIIDFAKFRSIADECGAFLMVDMAHIAGLVAAKKHPSPIPHAHFVTSTTHKTLRGPRGGLILCGNNEYAKKINSSIFPGIQGGPLMHIIAAKAYAFKRALEADFASYQQSVIDNAKALGQALQEHGFDLVTGGTDTHLLLISLINKNISGKDLQASLDKAYITLNKNAVPNDPRSPFVTSGVRIGTAVVSTRGMGPSQMKTIAGWITQITDDFENETLLASVRQQVIKLSAQFPLYT